MLELIRDPSQMKRLRDDAALIRHPRQDLIEE